MSEDFMAVCHVRNTRPQKKYGVNAGLKKHREHGDWYSYYLNSFSDQKGRKHISMLTFDIHDKKIMNERLQKYANDLKELNATKDRFFRIIAHDLRNPFNGLIGASDILVHHAESLNTEAIIKLSKVVHDSAISGYSLLNNLLEWSKAQTGRIEFNPEKIILKNLTLESFDQLKSMAVSKNITLNAHIHEDLVIEADRYLIASIMRNLVSNAVKFTPPGGRVTVDAEPGDEGVTIMVTDTGVGMTPQNVSGLFQIDRMYSTNGTHNEKGSGLGLLLMQGICCHARWHDQHQE